MFAPANQPQFNLTIVGLQHDFKVLAFEGHEAINQPYHFDIELVSDNPSLDLESLLHKSAFLAYGESGEGVHGLIYRMAQGDSGKRLTRYSLRLVPHIAYLKHRTNQRIFQQLSVPEIIAQVLKDHAILSNVFTFIETPTVFPPRDYCTQYDETDLAFIHRLCEEEGIHYHFEHTQDSYHLYFGDHEGAFPVPERPTGYVQDSGLAAENRVVKRFGLRVETRPSWVTRRDYDFENPDLLVESTFKGWDTEQFKALPDYEDYDYPGGFSEPGQRGKHLANRALERHRSDYQLAEGKSDQSALRSGHFLHMTGHPRQDWNQRWLINGVVHEGRQPQVLEESTTSDIPDSKDGFNQGYRNTFSATPQGVAYRPPLKHRKPKVLGSQTAKVTGPAGEDVHTDEYGRVKVQFFWDREGQLDEHSSCWLRVSSSWAGDRYGGIAIPRIGMEVLVTFLEGDPDQPVVSGCLYHGSNAVPYPLPANKTRTVFKTLSSLEGGGSNELRIEDRKGAEEIYLHAQRDWKQKIQNDQIIDVGNERHDIVAAKSFTELKAEEHRVTHGDRKVQLKAGDHLEIAESQHLKAGVGQFVEAGQEIHLKAGQKVVIEAGTELTLKAGAHFIKIDPSGVWINGAKVGLNAGGSAGQGLGIQLLGAQIPGVAKLNEAGAKPQVVLGNVQRSLMLKAREQGAKRCLICDACHEGICSLPTPALVPPTPMARAVDKEPNSEPKALDKREVSSAQGIFDEYKVSYNPQDRTLPFSIMQSVTGDALNFTSKVATPNQLGKVSSKKFTLRHYTISKGGDPAFHTISSNFELVANGVKSLQRVPGVSSNTNQDDWSRLGNTAFTFFLLSIDGKVSERKFLSQTTHYAEIDLEDESQLNALGLGGAEFFASPDLLHVKDLSEAKAIKGNLKDLKSLMVATSGVPAIQLGLQSPENLLRAIDEKFLGSLEVKIPGSVKVNKWIAVK